MSELDRSRPLEIADLQVRFVKGPTPKSCDILTVFASPLWAACWPAQLGEVPSSFDLWLTRSKAPERGGSLLDLVAVADETFWSVSAIKQDSVTQHYGRRASKYVATVGSTELATGGPTPEKASLLLWKRLRARAPDWMRLGLVAYFPGYLDMLGSSVRQIVVIHPDGRVVTRSDSSAYDS